MAKAEQKWPDEILIVRHGESAGNVARNKAEASGHAVIDIPTRDCDVPLSALGEQQADALGRWLKGNDERPTAIFTSPYVRAQQTTHFALNAAGLHDVSIIVDERLREKEFGILDSITIAGIRAMHPEQAEMRNRLGKFYFRPPGGESWCDVILRLRSMIDTFTREYRGERLLIVSHQVVVLCFRYLFERLTEEQILEIDHDADVANCAVTSYVFDPDQGRRGKLALERYNFVAPMLDAGQKVTRAPDASVAPQ
ncbi:MAG: histidine phosphatase family protein [Candidatus Eremiobacteraeota bacterium]|nr:histidine phosphatase family protein [Candidatus Eremiobacteraeota bacterium]